MTVKELIDILSEYESDSQVLIKYPNFDIYGSCWQDTRNLNKDDVIGNGNAVILDTF